jgi:hypothetical protein
MSNEAYRAKSNITTSCSVPQHLEGDYFRMRKMLKAVGMGVMEYNILCFNELHKGYENDFTASRMRLSK